jgi:RNA recognition motif-containing protein
MSKKLFVGNLPFEVNDSDLKKVFGVAGTVVSAHVVINKKNGRSKGFGFVEMETEELAQEAVKKFEGATLNERALSVQVATPKDEAQAKDTEAKEAVDPVAEAAAAPVAESAPETETSTTS